jgi:hypothetical protein
MTGLLTAQTSYLKKLRVLILNRPRTLLRGVTETSPTQSFGYQKMFIARFGACPEQSEIIETHATPNIKDGAPSSKNGDFIFRNRIDAVDFMSNEFKALIKEAEQHLLSLNKALGKFEPSSLGFMEQLATEANLGDQISNR